MAGNINASGASQKTRGKLHRKVYKKIRNQNGERYANQCENPTALKHKSYSL